MENIVRKEKIACLKQFLRYSQCFLPYMALIFHFKMHFKGGYLDFSHLVELKNIYITEIYMKKKKKTIKIINN